jgi:hypothetical protein
MPSRSSKRVVFGEEAARRIGAVVRRVEASPQFGAGGPPGGPRMWNPGVLDAVVTTAITQSSGSGAYGGGAARIQVDDDSGARIDDPAYPDPVSVKNPYTGSGTIAVGKHITISWRNRGWLLVGSDC